MKWVSTWRRNRTSTVVVLPLAAYAAIAIIATYPLGLYLASAVPSDIGDPLLNTWILSWDIHALLTNPVHLFQANLFFPLPNTLAYSEHLIGTALMGVPILLLTGEPVIAYNFGFLLSFVLGGWGTYLLVRRYTHHSSAAFLAGLAFAYAPYRLTAFSHLQLLTLQWLPLSLLCLEGFWWRQSARYPQTKGRWAYLGAFCVLFALQVATSWHLAVFAGFTVALYLVGWLFRPSRASKGGALRAAGDSRTWMPGQKLTGLVYTLVGLLVVALLVWPLITPYLALLSQLRQARPIEMAAGFGARLSDYLAAPPYSAVFGALTAALAGRPQFTEENYLFVGMVGLSLACVGLWSALRTRKTRPDQAAIAVTWAVVLIGAWAFTWGPYRKWGEMTIALPYALTAQLSPVFGLIRVPPRWMAATSLPLAVLVGFGVRQILMALAARQPGERGKSSLLAGGVLVVLALGLLAESWSVPLPVAPVGATQDLPGSYRWLAGQSGDFGVLEWPMYVAPQPEYPETRRLYGSTLHWKGLVNGYSGFTPPRQMALSAELSGFPDERALAALRNLGRQGVRYLMVHSTDQGMDRGPWEVKDRWVLERSTSTRPVYEAQGDFAYEINPWGDALVLDPATVLDETWRTRAPRRLEARWQGGLVGRAYETGADYVDLYWQAEIPFPDDLTVFVHLLDAEGKIVAQGDGPPVLGHYSTSKWQPGEVIRDRHALVPTLGGALETGTQLRIGLYYPQTQQRVAVIDETGQFVGDHVLLPR